MQYFQYGMIKFVSKAYLYMYLLRMAEITSGSNFEPNNMTEQKLGYV